MIDPKTLNITEKVWAMHGSAHTVEISKPSERHPHCRRGE